MNVKSYIPDILNFYLEILFIRIKLIICSVDFTGDRFYWFKFRLNIFKWNILHISIISPLSDCTCLDLEILNWEYSFDIRKPNYDEYEAIK